MNEKPEAEQVFKEQTARFSDRLSETTNELKQFDSQNGVTGAEIATQEQAEIAKTIVDSGASIVLVGLGCPRQETWVFENREVIPMPLMAVGAAFDFHAGTVSQAPPWLQDRGFEWLYRLVQEPRRLWKRYVYLNPLFLILVALQLARLRTRGLDDTVSPANELRFG